jgi:hypothetical protein
MDLTTDWQEVVDAAGIHVVLVNKGPGAAEVYFGDSAPEDSGVTLARGQSFVGTADKVWARAGSPAVLKAVPAAAFAGRR